MSGDHFVGGADPDWGPLSFIPFRVAADTVAAKADDAPCACWRPHRAHHWRDLGGGYYCKGVTADSVATNGDNDESTSHYGSLLVDCQNQVDMTATGDLTHRCPHVDEIDRGRVKITWRTGGTTLELHALARYLKTFAERRISHEAITEEIATDLDMAGVEIVSVETFWTTAGMEVRCFTSPTQPVTP